MAYTHAAGTTSSATVFEAVSRLFGPAATRGTGTGAQTEFRVTDERTLQALSRLSEEQLDDIDIRRKARHARPDCLALTPPAVTFDYFHACV